MPSGPGVYLNNGHDRYHSYTTLIGNDCNINDIYFTGSMHDHHVLIYLKCIDLYKSIIRLQMSPTMT